MTAFCLHPQTHTEREGCYLRTLIIKVLQSFLVFLNPLVHFDNLWLKKKQNGLILNLMRDLWSAMKKKLTFSFRLEFSSCVSTIFWLS